ncbi:MAG: PIN domain-containing protein, partial [Deltaproteobacteria bacterium]|nr:PIN domain-containing protein [Deltaproteobacteria bacterium]
MLTFFDTNLLVYLFDRAQPAKREQARRRFIAEVEAGRFVTSTQVLQEFYVVVTRKLAVALRPEEAEDALRSLAELHIAPVDVALILQAAVRSRDMRVSFWDALIIETALAVGADCLLSEDL